MKRVKYKFHVSVGDAYNRFLIGRTISFTSKNDRIGMLIAHTVSLTSFKLSY